MTRINHNIEAMVSQTSLELTDRMLKGTLQQLSTGLRINRAADDAANLSVSEQLRTQVRGSSVATRNAQDANSMFQIAEGAMDEVSSILQRMRELTVQAANDSFTTSDRAFMDMEFQGLKHELDRITKETQYNGMTLLAGGANSFGSVGGPSVLHLGVNNKIGIDTVTVSLIAITSGALSLVTANLLRHPDIEQAMVNVDTAIFTVSQSRSNLGSLMNRLDVAISGLAVQQENSQAAESVIRDTDFAKMSTEMVKYQILQQSGTAMLSQANSLPKSVLSLFGN